MKRALLVAPALGVAVALAITTPSAVAANLCVGPHQPCFATLAAAVKAARRGDTIKLGPGTFPGGVTISVSINIDGAGSGRTRIRGGGPVLTIGTVDSVHEPTVSISDVTITGGHTKGDGTKANGGGILIPAGAGGGGPGANVTISDSVISGNDAQPTVAAPLGPPCPGGKHCPYAGAYGGGIDNSGTLKLERTTIRGNQVGGPVASDADGAGIDSHAGSLTLVDCLVTSNRATAVAPNGRFADSGGIFAEGGTLTIRGSTVSNNSATLHAAMPNSVQTLAVAGGIHISDQAKGSITDSTVSGNSVTMTNSVGDANAFSGGVHTDASLVLNNDTITDNTVTASALGHTGGNAAGDSGAGEWAGKLTNTRVTGNSVSAGSVAGNANADAGATVFSGSMTNSVVSNNHVRASAPHGSATDRGAGLVGGDHGMTLRHTTVSGNTANANGRTGVARGGGIFDVDQSPNGPPGGPLNLINSTATDNVLTGSPAVTLQGGGIYATNPVSQTNSVIAKNVPDQCVGC